MGPRWAIALSLFSELHGVHSSEDAQRPSGVVPEMAAVDAISFGTVVSACAVGHQVDQAMRFVSTMRRETLEPDAETVGAAVSASARCAMWEAAFGALCEACVERDEHTMGCVIQACSHTARWQQAFAVLHCGTLSPGVGNNVAILADVAAACLMGSRFALTRRLFDKLQYGAIAFVDVFRTNRRAPRLGRGERTVNGHGCVGALSKSSNVPFSATRAT